jgi:HK97 gp10 family phage protein
MAGGVRLDDTALRAKLERAIMAAAQNTGVRLVGHLRRKLNTSAVVARAQALAGARAKRRRAAKFGWVASKPGDAPRKRTGTLQKSVAAEVIRKDGAVVIRVGSAVPYARFLERGTRKMAARPWLRPGILEMKDRLQRDFLAAVRRALAGP